MAANKGLFTAAVKVVPLGGPMEVDTVLIVRVIRFAPVPPRVPIIQWCSGVVVQWCSGAVVYKGCIRGCLEVC